MSVPYVSWRRRHGFYRVMVMSPNGLIYPYYSGSVAYMLRLLTQRRHKRKSLVVGRCWIEKNTEPATRRPRRVA